MSTITEALAIAIEHHRAGQLGAAEQIYRRILEVEPHHGEALNNLGTALLSQGSMEEAAACFRRVLAGQPDFAIAWYNLGTALHGVGKPQEAVAAFERAVELQPELVEGHCNLGEVFLGLGESDKAAACFREAVKLKPALSEVHYQLGLIYQEQSKELEAVESYRRAIEINPEYAAAWNNLGNALKDEGKLVEAIDCFRRALAINPASSAARRNLGHAYQAVGRFEEAIACFRELVGWEPGSADLHSDLGTALQRRGDFDQALASYAKAIELQPDCAGAHLGRSTLRLLQGDFERGWPEYEWRWKTHELTLREFAAPRWDGSSLAGRTLLIHCEQGLGDTLQFVRYAAHVKHLNPDATVIVECQRPLLKLLSTCGGIDRLVGQEDALPAFDVQAPLLSLPGLLRTTVDTIPAEVPYLSADSALVEQWRDRLAGASGLRIGIHWRGRPLLLYRDMPLEGFGALAAVPGVRLVSLQLGVGRAELSSQVARSWAIVDLGEDVDRQHGAFMDTAAIMMNLDLVITSDTAIAHVAGALGVPVWVGLPFVPDWRWLLERSDSPWYPTMRLFRQPSVGDWAGVFREIAVGLQRLLGT